MSDYLSRLVSRTMLAPEIRPRLDPMYGSHETAGGDEIIEYADLSVPGIAQPAGPGLAGSVVERPTAGMPDEWAGQTAPFEPAAPASLARSGRDAVSPPHTLPSRTAADKSDPERRSDPSPAILGDLRPAALEAHLEENSSGLELPSDRVLPVAPPSAIRRPAAPAGSPSGGSISDANASGGNQKPPAPVSPGVPPASSPQRPSAIPPSILIARADPINPTVRAVAQRSSLDILPYDASPATRGRRGPDAAAAARITPPAMWTTRNVPERAAKGQQETPSDEPRDQTIHVTIGRLEVRATVTPPAPAAVRADVTQKTASLEDYLRRRAKGSRP